jgi:hypothetical protein
MYNKDNPNYKLYLAGLISENQYYEALDAAQEIKSPTGAKVTYYFETAQGSKYILSSNNESRRIKSYHANTGGEDSGLKNWHDKCVFTPEKFQTNFLAYMQLNSYGISNIALTSIKQGYLTFMMFNGTEWTPVRFKDAYKKAVKNMPEKAEDIMEFPFVKIPTIGYNAIEWNEKSNKTIKDYHPGSPVSIVKDIKDATEDIKEFIPKDVKSDKQILDDLASKVGDTKWHSLFDVFQRLSFRYPEKAKAIGNALRQAGEENNMQYIQPFVKTYVDPQKL